MWGGSSGPHGPSGSGITIVILDLLGMLYFSQHRRRIEVYKSTCIAYVYNLQLELFSTYKRCYMIKDNIG